MDDQFRQDLQYDCGHYWHEKAERVGPGIPDPLFQAIIDRFDPDFKAVLEHPIGPADEIRFIVIGENGEAVLVHFEPPTTTMIAFLGSLAGGKYSETVLVHEGVSSVEGEFVHERCDQPIRVTLTPPPDPRSAPYPDAVRAHERTEQLLAQFRSWAAEPPAQAR